MNEAFFRWRTLQTVRAVAGHRAAEPEVLDTAALTALVGRSTGVATPLEISPVAEEALQQSGHYRPLYRAFGVDMMDEAAERSEVRELEPFNWVLLPMDFDFRNFQQWPRSVGALQGMRMYFRQRNPVLYEPGSIFTAGLNEHWRPRAVMGHYQLWERVEPGTAR